MPKKKEVEVKENISEKETLIRKVMADINKSLGPNAINRAEDYEGMFRLRRPTGILSLDIELMGGFPKGIVEINGESSVGKTQLACEVAKEVQNNYGDDACIGLFMAEKFDKEYWKRLGLKIAFSDEEIRTLEKVKGSKLTEEELAFYKEQVGEIHISRSIIAEEVFEAAEKMISSGLYQLVIIDSLGVLMTRQQEKNDIGDKTYGGISMVLQDFLNKVNRANTSTTIILINQLRDNMKASGMYDDPFKEYAGNALKYHKFVSLRLSRGAQIKKKIGPNELLVGRNVNWWIKKGKGGMSDGERGDYPFYKGKYGCIFGIDKEQDLIKVAEEKDVIERNGSWFSYNGERLGQGLETAADLLRSNKKLRNEIIEKIFSKTQASFIVKDC